MWMVVGLGNPGPTYAETRHNMGASVVAAGAAAAGASFKRQQQAQVASSNAVLWVLPRTFMNISGESVGPLLRFYKLETSQLIVVHDELDFPLGTVRLKLGGGSGGHNGIKSLLLHCGDPFIRVRIGIGKVPPLMTGAAYVLGRFAADEQEAVAVACAKARVAIDQILNVGVQQAMQLVHQRERG